MKHLEKAPAKLNLGLDTPFIHADGALEWDMVMTSIGLMDYVQIETTTTNRQLEIITDGGSLPENHHNLAYKAANVFRQTTGIQTGLSISIQKYIPVAAGLGGGSSDAAAVLRGLNQMFDTHLSLAQLGQLGLEIDADVPYCVYGKTAAVSGRGEIITPLKPLPKCWLVVAKPRVSVSTPKILALIKHEKLQHQNMAPLIQAVNHQNYLQIVANLGNTLEPVTANLYPQITILKERMLKYGADGAQMSGTGPTVFGICQQASKAKRIFNSLSGFCREVYLVRPLD